MQTFKMEGQVQATVRATIAADNEAEAHIGFRDLVAGLPAIELDLNNADCLEVQEVKSTEVSEPAVLDDWWCFECGVGFASQDIEESDDRKRPLCPQCGVLVVDAVTRSREEAAIQIARTLVDRIPLLSQETKARMITTTKDEILRQVK